MSVTEKFFVVTPKEAYERSYILPSKIAIAGPPSKMTHENIDMEIGAYSNLLIYTREARNKRPPQKIEGMVIPNAHLEFQLRIKQIASQVNKTYLEIQELTGLRAYVVK